MTEEQAERLIQQLELLNRTLAEIHESSWGQHAFTVISSHLESISRSLYEKS